MPGTTTRCLRRRHLSLVALALAALLAAACASSAVAREAYVTDFSAGSVATIETATDQLGAPIPVGESPEGVAVSPDGRFAYVANAGSKSVSVIETASHTVSSSIALPGDPSSLAVTPDGTFVYIAEFDGESVSVINTQTKQLEGQPIKVAHGPSGIAITPDGRFAFVTQAKGESVSVIDTQSQSVVGDPIKVGATPSRIAITPDGRFAYVADEGSGSVSVIDTEARSPGPPIAIPDEPHGVAIGPNGRYAYVSAGGAGGQVYVIDTRTNELVGEPIPAGDHPQGIAFTPNGSRAFVANLFSGDVTAIDAQANQFEGTVGPIGGLLESLAVTPDQAPHATFTVADGRPGAPILFNASSSSDPDGSIARYDWTFGDGTGVSGVDAMPKHVYKRPGDYKVTLTLTDTEGCSTTLVFTGQTANCDGSPTATQTQAISVSYPTVRLACPKSAGHRGCRFKLQAVTKRHGGRAESAVARASAKAGHRVLVALKATKAFAVELAKTKKVLVRERLMIHGRTHTRFVRLKIAN